MRTDAKILTALRRTQATGISGEDLARELGITRAAIWARIQALRNLGFDIEASPHTGYTLRDTPEALIADDLISRVVTNRVIGREIQVFKETNSTNDVVERLAREGTPEGLVVYAESQSKGRGRLGRKWASPAGAGLWFSLLLRPPLSPQMVTQLTVVAATGVARAILKQTGITPEIKWPNDILIKGRKVVGILTELNAEVDHVRWVVLGIGVDVNQTSEQFAPELHSIATSLRIESGGEISRVELAAEILRELDADYTRVCEGHFADVANEWEELCTTLGRNIEVRAGDRVWQGRAEALDEDGALLIRTQHGRLERIIGGDVTVAKN